MVSDIYQELTTTNKSREQRGEGHIKRVTERSE